MTTERQAPRKVVNRIRCIEIESSNPAVIVNISDQGLGFRALNPVTQSGTIGFSFSENGQRIDLSGELVWTDSTKKNGGMRFATLPAASRERIRNWVEQSGTAVKVTAGSAATAEAATPRSKVSPLSGAGPPHANAASSPTAPPPGTSRPQASSPGFVLLEDEPQGGQFEANQEMAFPNSGSKFFRGFLAGVITSAILAAVLFFAYGNPSGVLRTKSPENPEARVAPAVPPSEAVPPPLVSSGMPPSGSVGRPSDPVVLPGSADDSKTIRAAGGTSTGLPLDDHVSRAPQTLPSKATDPGDEDLALAQRYLDSKAVPASSTSAAHLLWAAVEKGNVTAEITLADLYARGDGVTKSCDQARVLLRAAAAKGSSEASQELAQIIRRGCR